MSDQEDARRADHRPSISAETTAAAAVSRAGERRFFLERAGGHDFQRYGAAVEHELAELRAMIGDVTADNERLRARVQRIDAAQLAIVTDDHTVGLP